MTPEPGRALCVFSSSSEDIAPRYFDLAQRVADRMCDARMDLVSGGGSISMMGVLARGVRSGGRRTVGVIPRALLEWEVCDHDADELLVTDDMRSRKGLMDARSDAFLALPGGLGTLEELLEAWVGRILGMHRKPVVVLDPWGDLAPLRRMVDAMTAAGLVRPGAAGDVRWTADISEAFEFIETAWAAGEGRTASLPKTPTGHPSEWLESD